MAKNKIVHIAEDFLDAAGFITDGRDALSRRLICDMNEKEGNMVEYYTQATQSPKEIETSQLGLADLFSRVALRLGVAKDVAKFVPLRQTDAHTVDDLKKLGRPDFAALVKLARKRK